MNSLIDLTLGSLQQLADNEEEKNRLEQLKQSLLKVPPFKKSELTKAKKAARLERVKKDYWYFDNTYFPPEMYDNYYVPSWFHRELIEIGGYHDKKVHIELSARDTAKTATNKKHTLWESLSGKRHYTAIGSQTLGTPKTYLLDLIYFLCYNPRITEDFGIQWYEKNTESLFFTTIINPEGSFYTTVSEEKSSRGKQRLFGRLDKVILTDFENNTSSLTKEAVQNRMDILNELRGSLSDDGVIIFEANNFDVDTLTNKLLEEQDKGIISPEVVVHLYPAFDSKRAETKRNIWPQRWPALTEETFFKHYPVLDEYDKAGNAQQRPKVRGGELFPANLYAEYDRLPDDLHIAIYVDPNLSLKGKGDTTAIPALGFSPSEDCLYLVTARCRSYSKSDDLLKDLLELYFKIERQRGVYGMAMDGNVSQESNWTNNISNFTSLHGFPYPAIEFKNYDVDKISTNLSNYYKLGKLKFPKGFNQTDEGKEAMRQFFRFVSKKLKHKDDFPDSLICALMYLVELGLVFLLGHDPKIVTISNRKVKRI